MSGSVSDGEYLRELEQSQERNFGICLQKFRELKDALDENERAQRIQTLVNHIFFRCDVYKSYEIKLNQSVLYPDRQGRKVECDLVIFKKPDDQVAFEAPYIGLNDWPFKTKFFSFYSAWRFWRQVCNQEDCLIGVIKNLFLQLNNRIGYSCALYDQEAFVKVCNMNLNGFHALALFRDPIKNGNDPRVIGFVDCFGTRIKGNLIEKSNGLLTSVPDVLPAPIQAEATRPAVQHA